MSRRPRDSAADNPDGRSTYGAQGQRGARAVSATMPELDLPGQIARIDRAYAETEKLVARQRRLQSEQSKLALSDTNVERFSLDGAAHRLLRGVSAVGSRR